MSQTINHSAKILSDGASNTKQAKSSGRGYMSVNLSFAPYDLSGHQVCPRAKIAKCFETCLGHATGRNEFPSNIQAKIRKTERYFDNPELFVEKLIYELWAKDRSAKKNDLQLACRLNNYSDRLWEVQHPEIFDACPDVQFYDYTKMVVRTSEFHTLPRNYDLTFSLSHAIDDENTISLYSGQCRMACVVSQEIYLDHFGHLTENEYITSESGIRFYNGDVHDLTFLRPKNSILVLKEKKSRRFKKTNPLVFHNLFDLGL